MSKIKGKKIKKNDDKDVHEKKGDGTEEVEKESSTLSDGVLDAFDELAPADPLESETAQPEIEEEDEIDSGDYEPSDEW